MDQQVLQTAEIVIGSVISLGILIAGFGYFYAQFFQGKNKKTKEEFELFTVQLEALRKLCEQQKDQIRSLEEDSKKHTSEIGRLTGIVESKDKTIAELNAVLQNRDPQLGEHIKFSRESIAEFKESIKKITEQLDQISKKNNVS